MPIKPFEDKQTLRSIREAHLNPTIEMAKSNDAKIAGLQVIVYKSFVKASVDAASSSIIFEKNDGTPAQTLDLTQMFQQYQHGVDVGKQGGAMYRNMHSLTFSGAVDVAPSGTDVNINVPGVTGEIGGVTKQVKKLSLSGNISGSTITDAGVMTINIPASGGGGGSISGQINGGGTATIDTIDVTGATGTSSISGTKLTIDVPSPMPIGGRIDVGTTTYDKVEFITLMGNVGTSTISGGEMRIDLPHTTAKVGTSTTAEDIQSIRVSGQYGASQVTNKILDLDIPDQRIEVEGGGKVVTGIENLTFNNATLVEGTTTGGKKRISVTPDPLQGKKQAGDAAKPVTTLELKGNIGTSIVNTNGTMTVDLPYLKGQVDAASAEHNITSLVLAGKRGAGEIQNGVMTITIPEGGGGGGGSIEGEVAGGDKGTINRIYVTGNISTSTVANDTLTINIPNGGTGGGDLTVTDGTTPVTAVEVLEFNNAIVAEKAGAGKHTAIVHLKGVDIDAKGDGTLKALKSIKFEGWTESNTISADGEAVIAIPDLKTQTGTGGSYKHVDTIELTGVLGGSGYHDGVLTIDLPAGGGGGPGGSMTGIVGTQNAPISSIQITGNVDGSSVDKDAQRMTVTIPDKVGFYDGTDTIEKVDLVQVAHSSMKEVDKGGKKLVVITPELMVFFNGWFESFEAMENGVNKATRIPTKTCAYAMDRVSNPSIPQHKLYIWMPNATTGAPEWQEVMVNSSLPFKEGTSTTGRVLSITKNDMVTINNNTGELTVKDVSVPQVLVDIKDGPGTIIQGKFTKLSFSDGPSWADLDTNTMELTLQRPIRRGGYGVDITGTHPTWGDSHYEGTIVFNQDGKEWWGYDDTAAATEQHKWKPIAYGGMSGDVKDLLDRVPQKLKLIDKVGLDGDTLEWKYSGWTGVPKYATGILPPHVQGQTGMVIQTFMGPTGDVSVPDQVGRIQIGYLGSDAAMYKRHRDESMSKWSDWVKMSFNPGDLSMHNNDVEAHKSTHPFYKAFTFGMTYKDLIATGRYDIKNIIDARDVNLIATDGRGHRKDAEHYIKLPYDGRFDIRGLIYLGGKSDLKNKAIPGFWTVALQKSDAGSSVYNSVDTATYSHNTTSLKYPPFSFKFDNKDFKKGESLRIKVQFTPKTGDEASFVASYPELWIMPGRSYISIDESGNETGFCMAESMSSIYGAFVPMGGGAFSVHTGTWPTDSATLYADGIEDAVLAG